MSVGYKKISEMISQEVAAIGHLSAEQQDRLRNLCNKIYMLEASTDSSSGARMKENVMGEISLAADKLRGLGGDL